MPSLWNVHYDEKNIEVINDVVTNGLERRDEDGGKLEILRLVVGGNMATASLDTAPVGEVDMGDELEDDEEADCYHLNKKSSEWVFIVVVVAMKF